ncbi:putative membrane protein, partial [Bacteroides fragilis str. J-143-4]
MIFILLLVQYQRSISLFYLLIIKGNIMKKNLLLVGALVSAFLLASCSG